MTTARTYKAVIDQAIEENAGATRLCYSLVVVFVVAGLGVLAWGAWMKSGLVALAGAVASGFFWPALAQARQIREMNMAIRLLEIPLSNAKTADDASKALRVAFEGRFNMKGTKK